jgi:cytochrome c556
MRLNVALMVLTLSAGFAGMAFAADDPIQARRDIMHSNQEAAKTIFTMIQGQAPYDAAKAAAAMKALQDDMATFPTLFPEGSDTGKTQASPAIWQNMDDFKAHAAKLAADAKVAEAAAADGLDAFKAAAGPVGQDCGACHQLYRLSRN